MDLKKRSAYFCFMLFLSIILWVIFGKHGIRKKKASINQLNDIIEVPQNLLEKYGHELQLSTSRPELDPKDQLRQLKKFLLVKIVPNFFPPLQTRDQTMANIEQIKKKEKLPDNFQRIWILHSILDTDFSERIWAQVFTDGEMTAMVPNPFENSKNNELTPNSVKEETLNVNSGRLLGINTAVEYFNVTWVILVDGQAYFTTEALQLVIEALNRCESNPICSMHCIPKYTTHTNGFSSFITIRTSYRHSGEQQQCQPAMKLSFIKNNLQEVTSWFSRKYAIDLLTQDQFDYHPETISDVLKLKNNSSCFECWGNYFRGGEKESLKLREGIVQKCGYVLRQPFNPFTITNRTHQYSYEFVKQKHADLRLEAIRNFDELLERKLQK